jgi:hypothetical protein
MSSISDKYKFLSVSVFHGGLHFDTYIACVYNKLYQSLRITEGCHQSHELKLIKEALIPDDKLDVKVKQVISS